MFIFTFISDRGSWKDVENHDVQNFRSGECKICFAIFRNCHKKGEKPEELQLYGLARYSIVWINVVDATMFVGGY